MKRILIDLTDIEGWHGHHGGTQRVVYGIAKQFFLNDGKEFQIEFIAFSAHKNLFYKTSFEPILTRVENQENTSSSQQPQPQAVTLKSRVKQIVRAYVPEKIRKNKHARATAKNTLSFGMGVARKAKHSISRYGSSLRNSSSYEQIIFTENDIVLVLGKPWDNPSMERALIDAKTNKGFMLVQAIYDLIIPLYPHLHHPTLFKNYTQYIFEVIYGSDLLLPISKCTDKDLALFARSLNLTMPKTKVIRLADEIASVHNKNSKPDMRIANKFIACVGTVEIRKNHTLLYYAYKLAEQQGIELPQLVIVGSRGWLTGDFQYLVEHDPSMKNKIIILDNVNDQGLSWIYANCTFSIYPSFYEGWGLPVAESLATGKVCIASNASSIPEISGDMIDYFTPYDAQACLKLIVKYLDPVTLKQKEAQLKKQYILTPWEDTFKEVNDSIHKLQSQPPNYLK
jgi:glycosyltransferase involved in cell wall biosynthesis